MKRNRSTCDAQLIIAVLSNKCLGIKFMFTSFQHNNEMSTFNKEVGELGLCDVTLLLLCYYMDQVQDCYELSAEYERKLEPQKLEELGSVLTSLDAGDSIVVAKSFTHMLNLANLAEEVQIAYRRRIKLKKGDFADEASATTESDIEETLKRLVLQLKKSPEEVFDALKNQTVDLVLTAHPTQSVRRSLLQKHARYGLQSAIMTVCSPLVCYLVQLLFSFECPLVPIPCISLLTWLPNCYLKNVVFVFLDEILPLLSFVGFGIV